MPRIPFYGEVEEHELGMLRPEEPHFAKVIFPRDLKSALAYRHMLASVYLLQRGYPCFRTDEGGVVFVISRSRTWTLQYIIEGQYWKVFNAKRKEVAEFKQIEKVLKYLEKRL